MDRKYILKNRIRGERIRHEMTQRELAKYLDVTRQAVGQIERGTFTPSARLAAQICLVFNKQFEELFYLEKQ